VGSTVGLNVIEKRKISSSYRESDPDASVVRPVAKPTEFVIVDVI
jgi:hypothetical protein